MALDWIGRAPNAPYFVDEAGRPWTPIGQNDAITWPEFAGLTLRRDLPAVQRHLAWLADHGVTCLRLMLEYAETGKHFFEQPAGIFNPAMIALWDDLFRLVEQAGLRILLTPMDTYFQWVRWNCHPYNATNGGPCAERTRLLTDPAVRSLVKARLAFATRRWGGSGALFAWDLWNEMHPVQGQDRSECFDDYIGDVGPFLRKLEVEVHGRAHPQCVSVFGPELHWKPWLNQPVFRHPALDFASSHFYAEGTIDHPKDTISPALAVARLMNEALTEIDDGRPFLESEHGPIHTFKDHGITLPDEFDDEYFGHMQWVHLACGGAGGGMRWPNRHPHTLTHGMRRAQRSLAGFVELIDWARFARAPMADRLRCDDPDIAVFGSADASQAIIYLLRQRPLLSDGRIDPSVKSSPTLSVSGFEQICTEIVRWDTISGGVTLVAEVMPINGVLSFPVEKFGSEAAIVLRRHANLCLIGSE